MIHTWRTPFALPRLSTAEFRAQKAAYIEQYGYTIQIPGFEDIFHASLEEPITPDEQIWWLAKAWDKFTPARKEYLEKIKAKRKRQFLNMLGSPQPDVLQARSSLLTSIDNAEDAMTTLQVAARIILKFLPIAAREAIYGPAGWFMAINDYLNLVTQLATPERSALNTKRTIDDITSNNPKMRKLQYKEIGRRALRGVTVGSALEGLQTMDQVIGQGICLGPLMNLPYDIIAANVRSLEGKKVTILMPTEAIGFWGKAAGTFMKAATVIFSAREFIPYDRIKEYLFTWNLAQRVLHSFMDDWPHNEITEIVPYAQIKAPEPTNILLLEAITETGQDPNLGIAWPSTGSQWSTCKDIHDSGNKIANQHFVSFCETNTHDIPSFLAASATVQGMFFGMEALGGKESISYDYTSHCKTFHSLLNAKHRLPYNLTLNSGFYKKEDDYNYDDILPEYKELIDKYFEFSTGVAKFKPEYVSDGSYVPDPRYPRDKMAAGVAIVKLPEEFDYHIGLPRSVMYTTRQAYKHQANLLFLRNLQNSPNAVHDIWKLFMKDYFDAHEWNGTSPSLPNFITYLKENYGIFLPKNETP